MPTHAAFARVTAATLIVGLTAAALPAQSPQGSGSDAAVIARLREEGLTRSRVMEVLAHMTDVLGARLTLSDDMARAQTWALGHMREIGLSHVISEPFMDYGIRWDNEYTSLHLIEPDYQPMVGYPLSHTPGTNGRHRTPVVIAEIRSRADLDRLRGTLRGASVLSTPPAVVDRARLSAGVARYTDAELALLAQPAPPPAPAPPVPAGAASASAPVASPNTAVVRPEEKMAFYKAEGVVAVLQSESGWPGAVRGFARPGTRADGWSLEGSLASPAIVAVTPEHYNRMYRLRARNVPVTIDIEVRNRLGESTEQARNLFGEIAGTDLADEVVMIGAHFDTWHASPNASDNTSGVAVVLEAMRLLRAVDARPRRTIRAALWAGEEQGLHGSREYVLRTFGDPASPAGTTPAYEKFSAYFNQDYGPGQYRGIYLQGNEAARPLLTAWTAPFHDLGMTTVSPRGVGSTDHISFDRVGLPGFQFLQDRVGGTGGHTNLDFIETIPPEDMQRNAVIMAAFAWQAAMADTRVPRKPSAGIAAAPQAAGQIRGRVFDEFGASIPDASVSFQPWAPNSGLASFAATTDVRGRFDFGGIPPGTYRVTGTALGYATTVMKQDVVAGVETEVTVVVRRRD